MYTCIENTKVPKYKSFVRARKGDPNPSIRTINRKKADMNMKYEYERVYPRDEKLILREVVKLVLLYLISKILPLPLLPVYSGIHDPNMSHED
jgi:hypothetical protein